ncbi:MAG TPA: UMP kinase [Candidatus Cloacimonadota bacterium]|nr:UMP kinase [Candidatus Cloacimonadota bacterium]
MNSQTYQPEKIHRILLKLSGEVLAGARGHGFDDDVIDRLTDEIIAIKRLGYSIAIVLGGGNIFRGGTWKNQSLDRVTLDNIGMLATVQNALYLAEILNNKNYPAIVFSSLPMDKMTEHYSPLKASCAMQNGQICFLAGGTGSPFFTTDTAAVLRAIELGLDLVLKATKVDGLFSADPAKDPTASFIASASYQECISRQLGVMDMTAFSLASENKLPIKVCNINRLREALTDTGVGTFIHP